ncbi:Kelch-like 26 [Mactra antiquata]
MRKDTAAVLNGFLYIAGGEEKNGVISPTKSLFRFDPRTGRWMIGADMHLPRQDFQIAVLNNVLYAVGGRISPDESLSSVERYDPATDHWEDVAELCSPRRCVAVACLNGKIYAVGGSGNKALCSRVERYTVNDNKWELLQSISKPRFHAHLVPINNMLYLVGGASIDIRGQLICVDAIESFSPEKNQWTCITSMRNPRSEFGCCAINEKIYLIGGYDWNAGKRLSDVCCFNAGTKSWTSLPDLKESLIGVAASTLLVYEKHK